MYQKRSDQTVVSRGWFSVVFYFFDLVCEKQIQMSLNILDAYRFIKLFLSFFGGF